MVLFLNKHVVSPLLISLSFSSSFLPFPLSVNFVHCGTKEPPILLGGDVPQSVETCTTFCLTVGWSSSIRAGDNNRPDKVIKKAACYWSEAGNVSACGGEKDVPETKDNAEQPLYHTLDKQPDL